MWSVLTIFQVTKDGLVIQVILKPKSVLPGEPLPQGHELELYEDFTRGEKARVILSTWLILKIL